MTCYSIQRTNNGVVQWYCGEAGDTGPIWSANYKEAVRFSTEELASRMADEVGRSMLSVFEHEDSLTEGGTP